MAKLETNNYYCSRFNIIPQLPSIASVAYSALVHSGGYLVDFPQRVEDAVKKCSFLFVACGSSLHQALS